MDWQPRERVKVMGVALGPGGGGRPRVALSCGHFVRWKGTAPLLNSRITHDRCIRVKKPTQIARLQQAFAARLSRAVGRTDHGDAGPDRG